MSLLMENDINIEYIKKYVSKLSLNSKLILKNLNNLLLKSNYYLTIIINFIDNFFDSKKEDVKNLYISYKLQFLESCRIFIIKNKLITYFKEFVNNYINVKEYLNENLIIYFKQKTSFIEISYTLYKDKFEIIYNYILGNIEKIYPYNIGLMKTYSITPLTKQDYNLSDILDN